VGSDAGDASPLLSGNAHGKADAISSIDFWRESAGSQTLISSESGSLDITSVQNVDLVGSGNKKGDPRVALVWLYAARDLARMPPNEGGDFTESAHAAEVAGTGRRPSNRRRFGVERLDVGGGHHG
jgi:hypothetical protein